MDVNQRALLNEAVEVLARDPDAPRLYKQLIGVYEVASKGIDVRLIGRPGVLNPLLEMMLMDYAKFERVMGLVDKAREAEGSDPLDEPGFARRPYMRELMANKRSRESRLIALLNQLRPERDRIQGTAKLELQRVHATRWQGVRTEREEEARVRLGRRLTKAERESIIAKLWDDVDAEIDALEVFVQQELRKPATARSPGFEFKLKPKKG